MVKNTFKASLILAAMATSGICSASVPLHLVADSTYNGNIISFQAVTTTGLFSLGNIGPETFVDETLVPNDIIQPNTSSNYFVQISMAKVGVAATSKVYCSAKPYNFNTDAPEGVTILVTSTIDSDGSFIAGACADSAKVQR